MFNWFNRLLIINHFYFQQTTFATTDIDPWLCWLLLCKYNIMRTCVSYYIFPVLPALPDPEESPCRRTYCGRGRQCAVMAATGRAECICQEKCRSSFVPVCGSDGRFYENHCEVYRTACLERRRIYVVHSKDCFFKGTTWLLALLRVKRLCLVWMRLSCFDFWMTRPIPARNTSERRAVSGRGFRCCQRMNFLFRTEEVAKSKAVLSLRCGIWVFWGGHQSLVFCQPVFSQTQQPFVVCQSGLQHRPVQVRLDATQVQNAFLCAVFGLCHPKRAALTLMSSRRSPLCWEARSSADLHLIHILKVASQYSSMRLTSFQS